MKQFIPVTYKLYHLYVVLQIILSTILQTEGRNSLTAKNYQHGGILEKTVGSEKQTFREECDLVTICFSNAQAGFLNGD